MEKISDIIKQIFLKEPLREKFGIEYLKIKWNECVGEQIAAHTKPLYIKEKKLFISVDSPIWATQLNFLRNEIINKINQIFEKEIISEIFFKIN